MSAERREDFCGSISKEDLSAFRTNSAESIHEDDVDLNALGLRQFNPPGRSKGFFVDLYLSLIAELDVLYIYCKQKT